MPFWFNQFSRYLYFGLIFTYFCSPSHDSNNNGFAFATISSSFYGNLDITLFKEILNLLRHMWTWPHVYHLISYYSPKQTAQAFLFLCLFLSAPLLHIHIYLCPSSLPGKPSLLLICPSRSFRVVLHNILSTICQHQLLCASMNVSQNRYHPLFNHLALFSFHLHYKKLSYYPKSSQQKEDFVFLISIWDDIN